MDNEFKVFVSLIKEKTKIDVDLFDENGIKFFGVSNILKVPNVLSESPFIDYERGITLFEIKSKTKRVICSISGTDEVQRNYALFITELAENYFFKEAELSRAEFFKALLFGEMGGVKLRKYKSKFSLPELPCYVIIISAENKSILDAVNILLGYGEGKSDYVVIIDNNQCALIKFIDEKAQDYRSSFEYASYLIQSVYDEIGLKLSAYIGGTADNICGLDKSYAQALATLNMAKSVKSSGNIHSFKEYTLIKILQDLPKQKLGEYMDIVFSKEAQEIFDDEELILTADEFMENSLNVSETARKLYLHRNTLSYRLEKIEQATGLDIRRFSDAVSFRLMTIMYKLLNK